MSAPSRQKPRFHVEGQTSTLGPRWQIWDGERHFARFRNIADFTDAHSICDELNTRRASEQPIPSQLAGEYERLAKSLDGYASAYDKLHCDIADDFRKAATIVRQFAALNPVSPTPQHTDRIAARMGAEWGERYIPHGQGFTSYSTIDRAVDALNPVSPTPQPTDEGLVGMMARALIQACRTYKSEFRVHMGYGQAEHMVRAAFAALQSHASAAVEAERERCAKVADAEGAAADMGGAVARYIAATIRSLPNPKEAVSGDGGEGL